MSPELFHMLILRPGLYEPVQAWCRKVWAGCAWGGDLAAAVIRETADEFLNHAVSAGWLIRGAARRIPGFGDCGGYALPTRNGQKVIADPSKTPFSASEYMYEPNRDHSAYAELVALTVLSLEYFERLTERWRVYAEEAKTAEMRRDYAEGKAITARSEADRALRMQQTARRRAHAIRRRTLDFRKQYQYAWLNAIAAAVPHVQHPTVLAQLLGALELALEKLRWAPADKPVWPKKWAEQWRAERGL